MAVCVNCHIILQTRLQLHEYYALDLSPDLVSIIEEWCGHEVFTNDRLCQECILLVIQESNNRIENADNRTGQQLGHACICICCGISLSRRSGRQCNNLSTGSVERNYVVNHIFPRQVPTQAWACNACWARAHRNMPQIIDQHIHTEHIDPILDSSAAEVGEPEQEVNEASAPSSSSAIPSSDTESWINLLPETEPMGNLIYLPNYRRTADTPNRCFVPNCPLDGRLRVPRYIKRLILLQCKIYITPSARVCSEHSVLFNWDILDQFEFTHEFTAMQIESMLNIQAHAPARSVLNFENVEHVSDTICKYWTGLSVANFLSVLSSVPQLRIVCKNAKTALGMYLVKLRTGESYARIATLFLMAKGTVCNYINKARTCVDNNYVPLHLGLGHLTREQLNNHNLLIPQGLFGTESNNPIVICDGTYIYMQKSSNYLFQKKTYSLHKYRNLVKPFLMVTCDGYIIDAFGPYAATQSDADIMKQLFQNETSELRAYFRENDVFILDRGFRDAIGLLTDLGYQVYKPEGLNAGERQLSTIKANKSRLVTLCRWVVEVVNGRFKQEFKIFRGEYFNVASKHLMIDFRVAAALMNNFHITITDRPDAESILNRALERLNTPNQLANYVLEYNVNRHRSNFVTINGQLPELNVFPVMETNDLVLFALGIYQIKQARSYYGEHIRENGTFKVEVDSNLQSLSSNSLLLRGRIKSRHQSRKVYYTYILINLNSDINNWVQRIAGYYCSCIIGKRTVGSCAHVMTIVWFLGWARHQESILPPASFLDNVLVRDDVENE